MHQERRKVLHAPREEKGGDSKDSFDKLGYVFLSFSKVHYENSVGDFNAIGNGESTAG
jgi:hypothetical protein